MRAFAPLATIALLSFAVRSPAFAQAPVRLSAAPEQWAATAGLRPEPKGRAAPAARVESAVLVRPRSGRNLGQVLMIVGGAGIVTGLIVDEPIITIAGAGVGGYGLYLYLR